MQETIDITKTPEFTAAVSKAVSDIEARILASLAKKAPSDDDDDFVRQLALNIAELNDQGSGRKRVAPEILAARARAEERMVALLLEAREKGVKPLYRLMSKVYFNERLIDPYRLDTQSRRPVPTEIRWDGVPNEAMRPLDDTAKVIYAEYQAWIGSAGKPSKLPRMWVSANGLTVVGDPPARREVASVEPFDDGLEIAHDPTAEFVHVLGTVAPPARQNFHDNKAK